jgi:hypothetical protein
MCGNWQQSTIGLEGTNLALSDSVHTVRVTTSTESCGLARNTAENKLFWITEGERCLLLTTIQATIP